MDERYRQDNEPPTSTAAQDLGTDNRSSMATVLGQSQGRQRKGSLRKAAMAQMRDRSSSLRRERIAIEPPTITTTMSADSPDDAPLNPLSNAAWLDGELPLQEHLTPRLLASPIASPTAPYASTTDEDEILSFYRPAASTTAARSPDMSLSRRRSNRSDRHASLTPVSPPVAVDLDQEWDYSETEWWGWVVLIVTWAVFVVGMGSCLGVWTWAWDVGETPYAPPDLEDDATLPITGYYPALIVCTAVMSWVWVVIAWVGMKYFRHAKVGVDG